MNLKKQIYFFKTKDNHYIFGRVFLASNNNMVINDHNFSTGIWLGKGKNRWAWQRDK